MEMLNCFGWRRRAVQSWWSSLKFFQAHPFKRDHPKRSIVPTITCAMFMKVFNVHKVRNWKNVLNYMKVWESLDNIVNKRIPEIIRGYRPYTLNAVTVDKTYERFVAEMMIPQLVFKKNRRLWRGVSKDMMIALFAQGVVFFLKVSASRQVISGNEEALED